MTCCSSNPNLFLGSLNVSGLLTTEDALIIQILYSLFSLIPSVLEFDQMPSFVEKSWGERGPVQSGTE